MDFFAHQDKARRNTLWLVVLFLLAVICLVIITNLALALALWILGQQQTLYVAGEQGFLQQLSLKTFLLISLLVCGAVACAILYKWYQLASGGQAVAESLGGRQIMPGTTDPDERQALNVVEEMAIASGMPVPPVYLLEHELGINAFAAGNRPEDAVIGLTRGCIHAFKRNELQGVVAHEFSHILNGDMRLNLRLIALLHGIVFIGYVGEMMVRSSSRRRKSNGQIAIVGIALMAIGWLGTLFGQLIKAAVSRQREYLADASAVQFTRDPKGIGNALKLIGGSQYGAELQNDHRREVSHLFFGQVVRKMAAPFATHPPLMERILRVQPDWDGDYLYRSNPSRKQQQHKDEQARQEEQQRRSQAGVVLGTVLAGGMMDDLSPLEAVRTQLDGLPDILVEQAHDSLGAVALCFALLLDPQQEIQARQLGWVEKTGFAGIGALTRQLYQYRLQLDPTQRLPLIELLLPALKTLSPEQYQIFRRALMAVIRADQHTDMFEWCLYQLVFQYLAPTFEQVEAPLQKAIKLQAASEALQLVLSLLAQYGHAEKNDADKAFYRGVNAAGLYTLTPLAESEADLQQLTAAVRTLGQVRPGEKPRVLSAIRNCIQQDGQISVQEREMVGAIAAIMGSPLPLFIDP
ncbi:M48 family metallopeptidase [Pontibacter sp. JAM-7]|uniref:M48 family metallopeptidase n=1 Tax=Pontibacter sp. JAM-7 TaxID=3366581 RepID=UPI003AF707E7